MNVISDLALQICYLLLTAYSLIHRSYLPKKISPTSFLFHFLPKSVLRRAVDLDFFVQLYSIWLVLLPGNTSYLTSLRRLGGVIQVCVLFAIHDVSLLSAKYIVLFFIHDQCMSNRQDSC